MPSPRLFVFGLGYTASVLATRALARGWAVAGTGRTEASCDALRARGIAAFRFAGDTPLADAAEALAGTTHLLDSAPPGEEGDAALRHHAAAIGGLVSLEWAGYLSTTGVYGDRDGAWVGEGDWLRPAGERQRRRVEAERGWLDLYRQRGVPAHVFRLPGIYGPGRSALDQVRDGTARRIDKPGQMFSRIHVEDAVDALEASMARPRPGSVYNVCDDEPCPQPEVVDYACTLLGVAPPPLVPIAEAGLSPMAASFWADNKRVRNDRIKRALGWAPRHPDYRAGLDAILAAERGTR